MSRHMGCDHCDQSFVFILSGCTGKCQSGCYGGLLRAVLKDTADKKKNKQKKHTYQTNCLQPNK